MRSTVTEHVRGFRFPGAPRNKYGNRKIEWRGEKFDSEAELGRYRELCWLQKHGDIAGLKRQVRFELIPSQRDDHGNTVERPVYYIADFVYTNQDDEMVVEDVKGMRTKEYIIKRKLMMFRYRIRIREVKM